MEMQMLTNILLSFGAVTVISKIIFDWLKNRPTGPAAGSKEKIIICSLDKSGATAAIADTQKTVGEIQLSLVKIDNKLDLGVGVAQRNTEHYEEFVQSLATLQNVSANVLKQMEENTKQIQRQGDALIKLTAKL